MKAHQLALTLAVALAGGFAANWLQSPASAQEAEKIPALVRAQRFELVDSKGRVRAHLHAEDGVTEFFMLGDDEKAAAMIRVRKDGTAALSLTSEKGKDQTILHSAGQTKGLIFFDDKGEARASLVTGAGNVSVLQMKYPGGKTAAMLTAQQDKLAALYLSGGKDESEAVLGNAGGTPELGLYDAKGKLRSAMKLRDGLDPSLWMSDREARVRVVAGANEDGWAGLGLLDPKGNVRGDFSTDAKGAAGVSIHDGVGKVRATIGVDAAGKVRLELADENSKSLYKQPKD